MSSVKLIHLTPCAMELCAGAMSKCYDRKVSAASVVKYGVQSGHLSVLEHAHATFDIECSLAVLGQITRHRHLSFTVMSTRGAVMDNSVVPEGLTGIVRAIFLKSVKNSFDSYRLLIERGVPLEKAAYVLTKGTITKLRVTGSLRAWLEYLPKRLCRRAMHEHRMIAQEINGHLNACLPDVFPKNLMNCGNCKETNCKF